MLDITRILTEKNFRKRVLDHVEDPVVLNFWTVEFASWNDKFAAEAVAPVLNKVGAFTANPLVRNIIGQPKSSFNVRQIMDERKILIINLSRGLVGEDNAALLGALIVTKIQMAAMSRADIPIEERTPFYLYVDEFQNFATDSFATILSEARKYGLNLTVANQYTAQMMQEVKDAVFGNVGSIIAFRTSADDARVMMKYFEPKFEEQDLVHMHNRHFVISMAIEGEKAAAFSAISLNLPPEETDLTNEIVAESRRLYAKPLKEVEGVVNEQYVVKKPQQPAKSDKPAKEPRSEKPVEKGKPKAESKPTKPKEAVAVSADQRSIIVRALSRLALSSPDAKPKKEAEPKRTERLPKAESVAKPAKPSKPAQPSTAPAPKPRPAEATDLLKADGEVTMFSRHSSSAEAAISPRAEAARPAPQPEAPQEEAPIQSESPIPQAEDETAPKKRRRRRRRSKTKAGDASAGE
jgi:hypothetical protein